jgi:hypothetical protein
MPAGGPFLITSMAAAGKANSVWLLWLIRLPFCNSTQARRRNSPVSWSM